MYHDGMALKKIVAVFLVFSLITLREMLLAVTPPLPVSDWNACYCSHLHMKIVNWQKKERSL